MFALQIISIHFFIRENSAFNTDFVQGIQNCFYKIRGVIVGIKRMEI